MSLKLINKLLGVCGIPSGSPRLPLGSLRLPSGVQCGILKIIKGD